MKDLKSCIREVPDFPKKGIGFKDITTLVKDAAAFKQSLEQLAAPYKGEGVTKVVGAESRGFIFGAPVAVMLGAGFVPVRKPKKLPAATLAVSYELEYGTDTVEMHRDAIQPGDRVLIIDDLLATGGTAAAMVTLVERAGGTIVGISFLVELTFLKGRAKFGQYPCRSLITYDAE